VPSRAEQINLYPFRVAAVISSVSQTLENKCGPVKGFRC
jgi:hypothetical protein